MLWRTFSSNSNLHMRPVKIIVIAILGVSHDRVNYQTLIIKRFYLCGAKIWAAVNYLYNVILKRHTSLRAINNAFRIRYFCISL